MGFLRPDGDDARGTPRGLRVDRQARTDRRERARRQVGRARPDVPGAAAQARARARGARPRDRKGAGTILELDREARTLKLKRGPKLRDASLPEALIPGGIYATKHQEDALERIGRSLLEGRRRYPAIESILRRTPFDRPVQTTDLDEMAELLLSLDGRHLVIQGPPGSGKTFTAGRLIARLIAAGKTVGVASTSHRAIHKLLAEVEDSAEGVGLGFRGLKKASSGNPESEYEGRQVENVFSNDDCAGAEVLGGTAWLFSDPDFDGTLDYLFVDEAGQVSLADALAMSTCARNVVLVGDPQQLGQVLQGSHPTGTEASVLEHLLGGEATVPPGPWPVSRAHLPATSGRVRLHLGGVLRGAPAA